MDKEDLKSKSLSIEKDNLKFKIMGQEFPYPNSWQAVAGLTIFCLLVGFAVWIIFCKAGHEHLKILSNLVQQRYSAKGELEETSQFRLVQFWTPSEKTQEDLKKQGPVNDTNKWEIVTEEKVNEFGRKLAELSMVIGYRRHEVTGHARAGFKRGWWWIVSVKNDTKLSELAKFYSVFWGNTRSVYFEEIRVGEQYLR